MFLSSYNNDDQLPCKPNFSTEWGFQWTFFVWTSYHDGTHGPAFIFPWQQARREFQNKQAISTLLRQVRYTV